MFRLGEPRPLRRPLGLSSPPYRYFLEQIGAGDLRPHRPQPTAGLDGQCLRRSRHRPVPRFNFRCAGTGGPADQIENKRPRSLIRLACKAR
jgi:hypothetical protein